MKKLILGLLLALSVCGIPAMAQEEQASLPEAPEGYQLPLHANLIEFLIKKNTVDLSDNRILDEVGMVLYCDIYEDIYRDEFKWNEFRAAMLKWFAMMKRDGQPATFSYSARVKIGRYNQQLKAFEFPEKTVLSLKKLEISRYDRPECNQVMVKILPRVYVADFRVPVKLSNLPVPEDIAKQVVEFLAEEYRGERSIYLRFNIFAYDVLKFEEATENRGTAAVLDAWVKSIDVFEDQELTRYIKTINLREAKSVTKRLGNMSGFESPFTLKKKPVN